VTATDARRQPISRGRRIGPIGTMARVAVGGYAVTSAVLGQLFGNFQPAAWLLGLFVLPVGLLLGQRLHARSNPDRLLATGPTAPAINTVAFLALYLTPQYAPAISFTSDAALLFVGGSMLLAATRGYAGCELLAISNWVLDRDDQVGCVLFTPVDRLEQRNSGAFRCRPGHRR
jgi:hypothetical protein